MIFEDAGNEIITTSAAYQPWEVVFDESAILFALTVATVAGALLLLRLVRRRRDAKS